MGKRLYVGNLSFNVTSQALEELFAQFGNVESAQVVQDRDTGRSKGFGFVEMGDENAAQEAIRGLHEKEHDGRPLTVNEARPREERPEGRLSHRTPILEKSLTFSFLASRPLSARQSHCQCRSGEPSS